MRNFSGNRRNQDHSHVCVIDREDQKRLQAFFMHELALYNTLIEAFESRTRAFPKQISAITDSQIQLLATLCEHGLQLKDLANPDMKLPERIKNLLPSLQDAQGRLDLPSHLTYVFDTILKQKFAVIPQTRRQMITDLLQFFREQADILKDPQKSEIMEVAYRVPPSNISKQDIQTKRHLQIPRQAVTIKYNHEQDLSEITTPVTNKPIQVLGTNLNEFNRWTTMVLRQEPGRYVSHDTPWIAEFKDTNNKYLIKLTDIGNKNNIRNGTVISKAFG